ncbi:MAG: T9SS type A sorting domain-containing protein [Ignavibacteriae bacterium]|nr:T9SS type A sorting domain-containing protein [Ignavibacteriota bacterium]
MRGVTSGPFPMYDDGMHGDSLAGDHIWGAQLDGFESGDSVKFTVNAVDVIGNTVLDSTQLNIYLDGYGGPNSSFIMSNVNNFAMWVWENGGLERNPFDNNSGTFFPKGTTTVIYAGGFVWGGVVQDGTASSLRVGGQTYNYGTVPGRIISQGIGENPLSPDVRIYRIRRYYETDDLADDAATLYQIKDCKVLPWMIDSVRAYYRRDWLEWPWQKGAPYYDRNNNGIYDPDTSGHYDPQEDEPGLVDADQVLWCVVNDLDPSATQGLYGSPPIGLEEQVTIWGYNRPDSLGNCLFQRCRLIYKGTSTTPPDARIDSMYIAKWSDPDVGDFGDDFAGCDTGLQIGYAYNSTAVDVEYRKFNLNPPAVGYILLQGPTIQSSGDTAIFDFRRKLSLRNLPMTTFVYFATGGADSDPDLSNYDGIRQWYNIMRGFRPRPLSPPECFVDPTTNKCTKFELTGDPLTSTGWIDGQRDFPGDRRIALVSGSFSMALGDTQEIVVALVGSLGSSNLNSITQLKSTSLAVKSFYTGLISSIVDDVSNLSDIPEYYALYQSYPNPFNPTTKIKFDLPVQSSVTLKIYNLLGQVVKTLVDEKLPVGRHEAIWDASNVAAGIYFYQLKSGTFMDTKKMILLH